MTIYTKDMIGVKQSVLDEFLLLNPNQIPFISALGFGEAVNDTTHKWFEDKMIPYDGKVKTAVDAQATTITVDDSEAFRPAQIIKAKDELIKVVSVEHGTGELTVVRGHASTEATPLAVGDVLEVLFVEGEEGRMAREARTNKRVPVTNITQIFDESIAITGTAQSISQYGISGDRYEHEKQLKLQELAFQLEKALINGVHYEEENFRLMRGIRDFIKTNVADAGGEYITLDKINDSAQKMFELGAFKSGGNYAIWVPAKQLRQISLIDDSKVFIQRADNVRGSAVTQLVTDFGTFDIRLNNNLRPDEVLILDDNRIKVRPLRDREWFHKYLGDQGDFTKGMLVGEYTLEFKQESAHARIHNLK